MLTTHSKYAVQISSYFLRPLGLWPLAQNAPLWIKLFRFLRVGISYCLMAFLFILSIMHAFLEESSIPIRLKLIGPVSFVVMAVAKYTSLLRRTEEIAGCFRHVEEDWERSCSVEKKVMYEHAKLGRNLTIFSAAFMFGGGFLFHGVIPIAVAQAFSIVIDPNEQNLNQFNLSNISTGLITKKLRILSFPIYKEWINVDIGSVYATAYLLQFLTGYILDTITVGTCSLAATFVTHTCAQLELVIMLIKNYIDGDTAEDDVPFPNDVITRKARLAVIVRRHIRALQFVEGVEKYLNGICFVEVIGCTWNLCIISYYLITEWERHEPISSTTYIILIVSFTTNIFIFCYIGELLNEQCTRIGMAYHITDWYNLPGKSASDLFFIMSISQYPKKLTAGKIADVTVITFSTVMKSAFTYLNLLRTMLTNNDSL